MRHEQGRFSPQRAHHDRLARWSGHLVGALLGLCLFGLASPLRLVLAASTPPPATVSWYVDVSDPSVLATKLYNIGCSLGTHDFNTAGTQDNVVILLFGKPAYANYVYGTYDWTAPGSSTSVFLSTSQIAAGVQQFARAYYLCTQTDKTSRVYVAVGVNNVGSNVTYNHGGAWARMALGIQSWINAHGYASQAIVRAANDMELNYNGPSRSRAWVDGYTASWNSGPYLYDVGNAAGCPSPKYPNWDCGSSAYP